VSPREGEKRHRGQSLAELIHAAIGKGFRCKREKREDGLLCLIAIGCGCHKISMPTENHPVLTLTRKAGRACCWFIRNNILSMGWMLPGTKSMDEEEV